MTQLRTELDRIASTTTWAGDKLLDGNFLSKNFQIGAMASENVTVSIGSTSSSSLGVYRLDTTAQAMTMTDETSTKTATDFDVLGKEGAAEAAFTAGSDAKAVAAAVNADTASTGVTATAVTKARISLAAVPVSTVTMTINGGGTATAISASVVSNDDLTALKDAINAVAGTTQVTAVFDGTDKSKLILTEADGDDILLQDFGNGAATNLSVEAGNYDGTSWDTAVTVASHTTTPANDAVVNGVVRMESSQSFTVSDQEAGTSDLSAVTGYFSTSSGGTGSLSATSSISLGTRDLAQSAISILDGAIARVNEIRSELGSVSNRLDHTISNLSNVVVNTEASRSRVQDADFAAETSNLTKTQILSQAATAMLAQANASKQSVLTLLQG
jgi:flagellin